MLIIGVYLLLSYLSTSLITVRAADAYSGSFFGCYSRYVLSGNSMG